MPIIRSNIVKQIATVTPMQTCLFPITIALLHKISCSKLKPSCFSLLSADLLSRLLYLSYFKFLYIFLNDDEQKHYYLKKLLNNLFLPIVQYFIWIKKGSRVLTYGSIDNSLSPVQVYDWLIFHCGNLIVHQKN